MMKTFDQLWNPPSADLAMPKNDVHVWQVSLDQQTARVHELAQMLPPDEQRRAESFYFEQDRRWFIIRRGLLRTLCSRYLGTEPSQLQFRYGSYGKPSIAKPFAGGALRFNVSHSYELALYAIAWDREIGIDIERTHFLPDAEQIAGRFFSAWENTALCKLPQNQKRRGFFNCWTRKEAYIKATGYGLAQALNDFSVSLAPGEPAKLLSVNGDPNEASRWSLVELTPTPGYVAALCVEGHDWRLVLREYPS